VRGVLLWDGNMGGALAQKTMGVLREMLSAEAAMTAYQELFFMFAVLTLFSILPVLLLRGRKPLPQAVKAG